MTERRGKGCDLVKSLHAGEGIGRDSRTGILVSPRQALTCVSQTGQAHSCPRGQTCWTLLLHGLCQPSVLPAAWFPLGMLNGTWMCQLWRSWFYYTCFWGGLLPKRGLLQEETCRKKAAGNARRKSAEPRAFEDSKEELICGSGECRFSNAARAEPDCVEMEWTHSHTIIKKR